MRPTLWASLALLCLPAMALSSACAAAAPENDLPKPGKPVEELAHGDWLVRGVGSTQKDATQAAEEKARQQVILYLASRPQPLQWQPSIKYLREQHIIKDCQEAREVDLGPDVGTTYEVCLAVQVTPRAYQAMVRLDHQQRQEASDRERQQRALERQAPLAKAVALLVALLAGAAVLFRAQAATQGVPKVAERIWKSPTFMRRVKVLVAVGFVGIVAWTVFLHWAKSSGDPQCATIDAGANAQDAGLPSPPSRIDAGVKSQDAGLTHP